MYFDSLELLLMKTKFLRLELWCVRSGRQEVELGLLFEGPSLQLPHLKAGKRCNHRRHSVCADILPPQNGERYPLRTRHEVSPAVSEACDYLYLRITYAMP